jgi:hypothetical protein
VLLNPDFQVGDQNKKREKKAHPHPFKKEVQNHEPQNEKLKKKING